MRGLNQPALDCGDEAASWVSRVLEKDGYRLNYSAPGLGKRHCFEVTKDWSTDAKEGEQVITNCFAHMCLNYGFVFGVKIQKGNDEIATCL